MIRVGIAGGASKIAGEMIKILINHPDVELLWAYEPELDGTLLSQIHKGLQGETYIAFTSKPETDKVDVIFLAQQEPDRARRFLSQYNIPESMRIIDLTGDMLELSTFDDGDQWIYGLPELCRKPLVRGARKASLPSGLSTIILLSLLPLAKNLLINAPVSVTAVVSEPDAEPGEALALIEHEHQDDIIRALRSLQQSFNSELRFVVVNGGWNHGISTTIYLDCNVSEQELLRMYRDFYSDHAFTYISDTIPSLTEVQGTNKCIMNLQKVGKRIVITAVIDDTMKGSASLAVHTMNLLFGLQERVGLMLKSQA